MDSFAYTLKHPLKLHNESVATVTVRRPLVRDLIAAERQPGVIASDAALVAVCASLSFGDFGHVDAEDFRAIMALGDTHGFFPLSAGGAESGETSSS